jgi:predicted DNA-binding protein with PD1-like motif
MKEKLLLDRDGLRIFAVVFDTGDEVPSGIREFAERRRLSAAFFQGIGAFSRAILGYFDFGILDYRRIAVEEQVEVVSLAGNIAEKGGQPAIHAHAVLADAGGVARGGHLIEGVVRPTLELFVTETPAKLERRLDEATRLALIRL